MAPAPDIGQFDLAPIPTLDPELIAACDDATAELAARFERSDVVVRRVFRYVQWRLLREGAASIQPSVPEREPQLVPPRRRYLPVTQQHRLRGCALALRHLDTRVAMQSVGSIPSVIEPETPMVLHAFVEAEDIHGRTSNAGCVRATPNRFAEGDIEFVPPPPGHCRRLLLDAVALANDAPAPALTRAAWLLAAVFAIHPFVDGNGRTGRLMFHGLLSESHPAGIDWGTIPELSARRLEYLDAARAQMLPSLPDYDARRLEPIHIMSFVAACTLDGTHRAVRRLDALHDVIAQLRRAGLEDDPAAIVCAVAADRNARIDELTDLVDDQELLTNLVAALVRADWLRWSEHGHLDLTGDNPFRGVW